MELFSADSEADFRLHVLHKKGIVIVDFWASWSEPSKTIRKEIEEAVTAFQDSVRIIRVDVVNSAALRMPTRLWRFLHSYSSRMESL